MREKFENYDRIVRKWHPIMDVLDVKDYDINDFLCEYAENTHNFSCPRKKENIIVNLDIDPYGEEDWNDDNSENIDTYNDNCKLLPVSLKILSKLNLKDKNLYVSSDNLKKHNLSVKCEENIHEFLLVPNLVEKFENILREELICKINKELENKNNFYVNILCHQLVVERIDYVPTITLKCEYGID